jgi:hypothetical protein
MVQLAERTLSRRPARDLPSRGLGSELLLVPGPEDRLGPLTSSGTLRPSDRRHMPMVLAACALLAGIGTAALVRPWRSSLPRIEIVQPVQPETAPSVEPPAPVATVPPPPAVIATTVPPERLDGGVAKAPDRVAPAARPAVPQEARDSAPAKPVAEDDPPRRDRGASQDPETRPSPGRQKRVVRSIRRTRPAQPSAEVEETGSNAAKPRAVKPDPSHAAPAKTWNLPSVLRPDGM